MPANRDKREGKKLLVFTGNEHKVLSRALKTEMFMIEEEMKEATAAGDAKKVETLQEDAFDCATLIGMLLVREAPND